MIKAKLLYLFFCSFNGSIGWKFSLFCHPIRRLLFALTKDYFLTEIFSAAVDTRVLHIKNISWQFGDFFPSCLTLSQRFYFFEDLTLELSRKLRLPWDWAEKMSSKTVLRWEEIWSGRSNFMSWSFKKLSAIIIKKA